MRALLVVLISLVALVRVAAADDVPIVKPPAGWRELPELAQQMSAKANEVTHFGGAKSLATVRVYVPPGELKGPQGQPLVILVVAAVAGEVASDRDLAARVAVDELHATTKRAALSGGSIKEDGWEEKVDPAQKQIDARLVWHDDTAQTRSVSHVVIAATADRMVSVTGECVEATDVPVPKSAGALPAQLVAACKAALETLDPGLDPSQRVALSLAPAGTEPAPRPTVPSKLPSMSDGSRTPLPPMAVPQQERAVDRRPVYVGLGLVVLAALFWWNRRRRSELEGKPK